MSGYEKNGATALANRTNVVAPLWYSLTQKHQPRITQIFTDWNYFSSGDEKSLDELKDNAELQLLFYHPTKPQRGEIMVAMGVNPCQ